MNYRRYFILWQHLCYDKNWPSPEELRSEYEHTKTSMCALSHKYDMPLHCVEHCLRHYEVTINRGLHFGGLLDYKDGHRVRSTLELAVDNYLSEHDIEHDYEPKLPFNNKQKADFLVGDTYIEIWGFSGTGNNAIIIEYNIKRAKKEAAYQKAGLRLIGLCPEDIPLKLEEKLQTLMVTYPHPSTTRD